MASYGQHAARIGLDHINWTQFPASDSFTFFQRRPGPYCAKKTQVRSGWPGQVLTKNIWSKSKLVCKNHRAWFLAECNQKLQVYKFPHCQTWLPSYTDGLDHTVHNQARSDLVLADCIRFWLKQVWSGREPVCKNHPACFCHSGQYFRADLDQVQTGSGTFTGLRAFAAATEWWQGQQGIKLNETDFWKMWFSDLFGNSGC